MVRLKYFEKVLCILVVCILVLLGLVTACAPKAAPEKPIILRFHSSSMPPPGDATAVPQQYWGTELEKRTGGKVKVEFYWGSSLLKTIEAAPGIRTGGADAGFIITTYWPDNFPLYEIAMLPMLVTDLYGANKGHDELVRTMPAVANEFTTMNLKFLWPICSPTRGIVSTSPIRTLADMKGKRFQTAGRDWPKILTALGATPVAMTVTEIYSSMQKGLLDGAAPAGIGGVIFGQKLYEVGRYVTIVPGTLFPGMAIVMNLDYWNKLPSDIQKVIEKLDGEMATKANDLYLLGEEHVISDMKKAGTTVFELSAADVAKLVELSGPIQTTVLSDLQAKGLPAKEVLDSFMKLYEKYKTKK